MASLSIRVLPVVSVILLACSEPAPEPAVSAHAETQTAPASSPTDCLLHVQVQDAQAWAKELKRTEDWVLANHRTTLWKRQSPDRGDKVGELRPGAVAVVVRETETEYRVRTAEGASEGWLEKTAVGRTLYLHVKTGAECKPVTGG
jgi:hypothetical protein